ncbi:hypothetical protein Pcinc_020753 [Petrolisthes cinctipes]|uniref:Uncharacterized protein n=1 Tax=Petrolisthes cinctipes TaxID=88211 RepID=A0AAE1FHH1_PETCI|nr:hypothetical protein Pcinc_020753 [Petrolisthes cinctipes]
MENYEKHKETEIKREQRKKEDTNGNKSEEEEEEAGRGLGNLRPETHAPESNGPFRRPVSLSQNDPSDSDSSAHHHFSRPTPLSQNDPYGYHRNAIRSETSEDEMMMTRATSSGEGRTKHYDEDDTFRRETYTRTSPGARGRRHQRRCDVLTSETSEDETITRTTL